MCAWGSVSWVLPEDLMEPGVLKGIMTVWDEVWNLSTIKVDNGQIARFWQIFGMGIDHYGIRVRISSVLLQIRSLQLRMVCPWAMVEDCGLHCLGEHFRIGRSTLWQRCFMVLSSQRMRILCYRVELCMNCSLLLLSIDALQCVVIAAFPHES